MVAIDYSKRDRGDLGDENQKTHSRMTCVINVLMLD
jgi:hypothetical protein